MTGKGGALAPGIVAGDEGALFVVFWGSVGGGGAPYPR